MRQKLVFVIAGVYFIGVALLAVLLVRASPGPESQTIQGVGLGHAGYTYSSVPGAVYLSGRRLTCEPLPPPAPFREHCRIAIAGKPLDIYARRTDPFDPTRLHGTCTAQYNDHTWPCEIGSRHIGVFWFAHINPPLDLSPAQLTAIRRHYPIENLPESSFLMGLVVFVLITTLISVGTILPLLRSSTSRVTTRLIVGSTLSLVVAIGSCIAGLVLTRGFWD